MAKTEKRYCAFCSNERTVLRKAHVSWTDVATSLIMASLLSYVIWEAADPRAMALFAVLLGLSEFMVQLRWRVSISCPICGFDPVLYKRSPERAAEKVKGHLDRRRADPNYLLSSKPYTHLPVRKARRISTHV